MGARTYDYMAHLYMAHLDLLPFGGWPLFVFTHHWRQPRESVTFWQESPEEALARWTAMGLDRVYVDSGVLVSSFLARALIDDLVLPRSPSRWATGYR